ncbi:cell wall hydrolase [bacterium]|nr:cell wall hydrolase [bacterium]
MTAEILVVALTLLGEARGEGFEGMAGVASVIQTRAIERHQTPSQVCLASLQFSFWNSKPSKAEQDKLMANPQANNALHLAKLVCERRLPDVVNGANHYHAVSVNPKWAKKSKMVAIIKKHKFYKISFYCIPLPSEYPEPPNDEANA